MTTTAKNGAATTFAQQSEPVRFASRFGSADFIINVRYSQTSAETLEDKILKLIEREVCANA
jgi:hypothetical protein